MSRKVLGGSGIGLTASTLDTARLGGSGGAHGSILSLIGENMDSEWTFFGGRGGGAGDGGAWSAVEELGSLISESGSI